MINPRLKAKNICNSYLQALKPKIAKEYVFANADGQTRIKLKGNMEKRIPNAQHHQFTTREFILPRIGK